MTLAFTTFVLFQFFNVFNARSEHGNVFNKNFFSNGKLWLALGAVLAMQVLAIAVASSVLLLDEGRKLLVGLAQGKRMAPVGSGNTKHQ